MLSKTRIRRPVAVALMLLGAAMILLAAETKAGVLLFALGVTVEVLGIAIKRKK